MGGGAFAKAIARPASELPSGPMKSPAALTLPAGGGTGIKGPPDLWQEYE